MTQRLLTDSADVLRAAGLIVIEMPGWQDRYETDGGFLNLGIMFHHDAMGLHTMAVPNNMSKNGVGGSNFWVRFDGVWVIMSAGRKWHAGLGDGWGGIPANSGNTYVASVETDYSGTGPWPEALLPALYKGTKALRDHYDYDVDQYCCGHKEYAPNRKIDPANTDLNAWRSYLKSSPAPTPPPSPDWFKAMSDSEKADFARKIQLELVQGLLKQPDLKKDLPHALLTVQNNLLHKLPPAGKAN